MLRLKIHCFVALILVALFVGLVQGMSVLGVLGSIKSGVGGTLSNLALIMGFGATRIQIISATLGHDCGECRRKG